MFQPRSAALRPLRAVWCACARSCSGGNLTPTPFLLIPQLSTIQTHRENITKLALLKYEGTMNRFWNTPLQPRSAVCVSVFVLKMGLDVTCRYSWSSICGCMVTMQTILRMETHSSLFNGHLFGKLHFSMLRGYNTYLLAVNKLS